MSLQISPNFPDEFGSKEKINKRERRKIRIFSRPNIYKVKDFLDQTSWNQVYNSDDVNDLFKSFITTLNSTVN